MPLTDPEREGVRRALDLLSEARARLGFTAGRGELERAVELLEEIDGMEPVVAEGDEVDRLREKLTGRFA